jgi:hypothetical protein
MKRFADTCVKALGLVSVCVAALSAEAATPRSYVSVNGSDLNTCNVPATPCRTYTGAISQVSPGGEVIVLDSGTFGGGTITQSVTINAPSGIVALAATTLTVNPGAGNTVVLHGLTFISPTTGSGTAIFHQSGKLYLESVVIDGWLTGLDTTSGGQGVFVKGSVFRNNAANGLLLAAGEPVAVDDSFFEGNGVGFSTYNGAGNGYGRVSNTVMIGNGVGALLQDGPNFTFDRCQVSSNTYGVSLSGGPILRLSASTITRNTTGVNGGPIESFGNNVISGNTTDTNGTTINPVALQ